MENYSDIFIDSVEPLIPTNAVAALLVLEDGRYIMQLRDFKAHIFYPGYWGLFGGAVDGSESDEEALRRELQEELAFVARSITRFVSFDFDLSMIGAGNVYRAIYEVPVTHNELACFSLREGLACEAFTTRTILTEIKVTPYDAFAVWIHHARQRLCRRM